MARAKQGSVKPHSMLEEFRYDRKYGRKVKFRRGGGEGAGPGQVGREHTRLGPTRSRGKAGGRKRHNTSEDHVANGWGRLGKAQGGRAWGHRGEWGLLLLRSPRRHRRAWGWSRGTLKALLERAS